MTTGVKILKIGTERSRRGVSIFLQNLFNGTKNRMFKMYVFVFLFTVFPSIEDKLFGVSVWIFVGTGGGTFVLSESKDVGAPSCAETRSLSINHRLLDVCVVTCGVLQVLFWC